MTVEKVTKVDADGNQTFRAMVDVAWNNAEEHGFHKARAEMTAREAYEWNDLAMRLGFVASDAEHLRDTTLLDDMGWEDVKPFLKPWQADLYCTLVLMATELAEAIECVQDAELPQELELVRIEDGGKPVGFASELADVVIRIMDTAQNMGIDLASVVAMKNAYNRTRPHMHGRNA